MPRTTIESSETDESLLASHELHRRSICNMSNNRSRCFSLCTVVLTASAYSVVLFAIGYYTGLHGDRELDDGSNVM